jgi:MFS family permease
MSWFYEIEDPTQPTFYYPVLIFLTLLIMGLRAFIHILKKTSGTINLEDTLLADVDYPVNLMDRKDSLRYRYLICYILTKANIWAKTAYLWTLYNKVHGFNVNEIAILYLIDNLSTLVFSPITGSLADKFGRKLFCIVYCVLVVSNLSLRLTESRTLAYFAQVLTGISATLINTTFESWVNYEASKEFGENKKEKEKFLKKLFKTQTLIDSVVSIFASCVSAFFYNIYGIKAPIIISMICATLGMITTCILWDENNPNKDSK